MSRFDTVVGCWADLVIRLDRSRKVQTWHESVSGLEGVSSVEELPGVVGLNADRSAADAILGALVRLAAKDGGDDADAALVVVHLLRQGVDGLARRFSHRGPDVLALVVGELTCQIRSFPWRTSRPYPGRLLLDTKHALWNGELRPIVDGRRPYEAFLVDPLEWGDRFTPRPEAEDVDLVDLLSWAASSGVVEVEDLRLLVALEEQRGYGNQARQTVADEWGINERTVRRRRDRALAKLRAATGDYLAIVA